MGGYSSNPEDIKRLVHFEYQIQSSTVPNGDGTKKFQLKSCLIPINNNSECELAGRAYAYLMSLTNINPLSENTLVIRDDFIFYER